MFSGSWTRTQDAELKPRKHTTQFVGHLNIIIEKLSEKQKVFKIYLLTHLSMMTLLPYNDFLKTTIFSSNIILSHKKKTK